ncbi:MAG: hypothetical protein WC492_01100 [Candidatus Micrarchaeia archaeon]
MEIACDSSRLQYIALAVALLGILILYFWPAQSGFATVEIARINVMDDGQKVQFVGTVQKITAKSGGNTLSVCSLDEECISVYAPDEIVGDWSAQDPIYSRGEVNISGTISAMYSNRFVRAQKIFVMR